MSTLQAGPGERWRQSSHIAGNPRFNRRDIITFRLDFSGIHCYFALYPERQAAV
jgi:hypothetical protein